MSDNRLNLPEHIVLDGKEYSVRSFVRYNFDHELFETSDDELYVYSLNFIGFEPDLLKPLAGSPKERADSLGDKLDRMLSSIVSGIEDMESNNVQFSLSRHGRLWIPVYEQIVPIGYMKQQLIYDLPHSGFMAGREKDRDEVLGRLMDGMNLIAAEESWNAEERLTDLPKETNIAYLIRKVPVKLSEVTYLAPSAEIAQRFCSLDRYKEDYPFLDLNRPSEIVRP